MNALQVEQEQTKQTSETPTAEENEFLDLLLGDKPATELNKNTESPEKVEPTDGAEKQEETAKPRSIAEAAERLGLKVEEVYALEIPLAGDGSKVTIGSLKDSIESLKAFEGNKLAFEEEKVKFELGATRAKDELSSIVAKLKDVIPAKHFETLMESGRKEYTAKLNEQRQKLMEYVPEWNDRDTLAREIGEINEFLEPYFGKKAFDQFNNAKMIKLLRDVTKREQRVRAAVAKMTEITPTSKAPSRKAPVKTESRPVGSKVDPRRQFIDGLFK